MERIVVVGAGQASSSLMVKLRSLGFDGDIVLIGDEPHLPYQRPPLSKKYLAGDLPRERLLLRQESWYEKNRIETRLGQRVTAIDRSAKSLQLQGGETISYDQLALTTGSRPRRLPQEIGGHLDRVFLMRDLADADALGEVLKPDQRLLVIGGGYIGLEAASEAAKKGLQVTLVEAADRILQRVAAKETSDYFRDLHGRQGVAIREGVGLERLVESGDGGVTAMLTDGTALETDLVVVGIGIQPNSELASDAGLAVELGAIKVDNFGRTTDPSIFAAGDCTCLEWEEQPIRLESVQNAQDQATAVAANMLGRNEPYRPKPWFWSDQYDVTLQIAGLNLGYNKVIERSGGRDARPGCQAHFYYQDDRLLAVDAMNDPLSYNVVKRALATDLHLPQSIAADVDINLKTWLKEQQ
jgi:3-phenylpropionate/trans-cinnamate dioxygenase ferredoxin reductase subunit